MGYHFAFEPVEPARAPTPEIPHQDKPPEGTPSDPVNVPPPAPDVITPDSDPDNIPTGPGLDIPEFPVPAEVMIAISQREMYRKTCRATQAFAAMRWEMRSRGDTLH